MLTQVVYSIDTMSPTPFAAPTSPTILMPISPTRTGILITSTIAVGLSHPAVAISSDLVVTSHTRARFAVQVPNLLWQSRGAGEVIPGSTHC